MDPVIRARKIKAKHPIYFRECIDDFCKTGLIQRRGMWRKRLYIEGRLVDDIEAFAYGAGLRQALP